MSDLNAEFEQAQADVKTLTKAPGRSDLEVLYGAYKQAVKGDVDGKKPGRLDIMGRGKYEAWEKFKGTSAGDAKRVYVNKVAALLKTHKN
jgi:diazepam-binding inhibitor (GABA receptor modulating acyl-CoA-binding protein)